jgi:hypothetical protein
MYTWYALSSYNQIHLLCKGNGWLDGWEADMRHTMRDGAIPPD